MVQGYTSFVRSRRLPLLSFLPLILVLFFVHSYYSDLTYSWYAEAGPWLREHRPSFNGPHSWSDTAAAALAPPEDPINILDHGESSPLANVSPVIESLPWAQEHEYATGKWVPRTPLYSSFEDYKFANQHKNGWLWKGCRLFNDSGIEKSEEKQRLRGERMVDLMNWVWQPDRGQLVPFDPVEFVVRLLQSPGGMIMLGDSITRQHHDTLMMYFLQVGIQHDHNPAHLTKYNHTSRYVLRPSSAMTKVIQERAGVPDSRMRRPFLTTIQDHMIIPEEDIRAISNAPDSWLWPIRHHPHVTNLMEILEGSVAPVVGEEETVTKDSILMFSTGPHWSRSRLPIPHSNNYPHERATLLGIYAKMMDLLTTRFTSLQRTTIFYRSSAAPHPQCEKHTKPYPNLAAAQVDDVRIFQLHTEGLDHDWRRIHARWDWDLWSVYNTMWIERVNSLARSEEREKDGKVKWHFLDIAQMSMQRPDAHYEPGEDCLHYCLPTIYNEWTNFLYHRLFLLGEVPPPSIQLPPIADADDEDL